MWRCVFNLARELCKTNLNDDKLNSRFYCSISVAKENVIDLSIDTLAVRQSKSRCGRLRPLNKLYLN